MGFCCVRVYGFECVYACPVHVCFLSIGTLHIHPHSSPPPLFLAGCLLFNPGIFIDVIISNEKSWSPMKAEEKAGGGAVAGSQVSLHTFSRAGVGVGPQGPGPGPGPGKAVALLPLVGPARSAPARASPLLPPPPTNQSDKTSLARPPPAANQQRGCKSLLSSGVRR